MDKETRELLDQLNKNVGRMADGTAVKTAAQTDPKSGIQTEEKSVSDREREEEYVNPLRKSFERVAKNMRGMDILGTTKVLDDPFGFLRAKNADGSYRVKDSELEQILCAVKAANDEDPIAAGAQYFEDWKNGSGKPDAIQSGLESSMSKGMFGPNTMLMKAALDTSSGGALIRTDLEPMLHEGFLRKFPGFDAIPKIPSNGLVHTFNQQTAMGSAQTVSELGSLSATESTGTYGQTASTNIAVLASQRAVGLKLQYASRQSGMNFGLGGNANTEVMNALRSIAKLAQTLVFQGNQNSGASSAVADDEDGLYDANAFTGLRQQLKSGSYSITKANGDTYLATLRKAIGQLLNAGAELSSVMLFLSVGAQNAIDSELEQFFTVPKGTQDSAHPTNFGAYGIRMLQDILARSIIVPSGAQAEGIGYYTYSAAATEDMYVIDPEGIKIPYLGSPTPVILELPIGYNNALSNVYIPFVMYGLAVYMKAFNRKIRIPRQVV